MKTKIMTLAAAAAIALGTAGLATSASAWGTASGTGILAETTLEANVQMVHHRPGHFQNSRWQYLRCRKLYILGFIHGKPYYKKLFYKNGCRRYFNPGRGRRP